MKTTTMTGLVELGTGQTISPRRLMKTSMSTRVKTMVKSRSSCLQRPITEESTSEFSVFGKNKVLIVVCTMYIQSKCVRPSGYLGSREIINYPQPTQQKPPPYIKHLITQWFLVHL